MRSLIIFVFVLIFSTSINAFGRQESEPKDLIEMIRELRSLGLLQFQGSDDDVRESQRRRIQLATEILDSADIEEPQRIYATVARLQSYSVLFSVDYRQDSVDSELIEKFTQHIENGLEDEATEVVLEATTAAASFYTGLYKLDSTDVNADKATEALKQLTEFEPQIPIMQTTRRLMLEQLWETDNADKIFARIAEFDSKVAKIVADQLAGETTKLQADFLWARHFAKLGELLSMRRLAAMYENGEGTRKNLTQAGRWHSKLAKIGDVASKIKIADFYLEGKGFSKDANRAVELYREVARTGSRVAQFKLGQCYLNGRGVEKSEENWLRWIKTAAENAQPIEVQNVYLSIDFRGAADSYRVFYESLVDQFPDDIYYLNNLAYSLLISSKKDPQRSLELIEQAIEKAPADLDGLSNFVDTKATALKQLGKKKEAAELYESVLNDMDNKANVLRSLVECYLDIDSDKAERYRQQLEKLEPDDG